MRNIVWILVAVAACQEKKESPPPPTTGEPAPAQANRSGKLQNKMANCPSAVPGAKTTIAMTSDGVDVTVTAREPAAERKIVELAEFHARTAPSASGTQHTGKGGGPARIGFCPTVHAGATVRASHVAGGVRVEIRASSPTQVSELQTVTKARASRLPGFVSS